MGEYHQAVASAQQTLASAEALGDFSLQMQGKFFVAQAYDYLGDYHRAIGLLKSNVASLEDERRHGSFGVGGLIAATSRNILARCLTELGAIAEACPQGPPTSAGPLTTTPAHALPGGPEKPDSPIPCARRPHRPA